MADELKFQLPKEGFDSYLDNIIPEEQAILAGAFGASMQQIKNIDKVDFQTFAKVVYNIETNNGLPLTNGTNVPTATFIVDAALTKVALGSGLYGTYTHSDFIGSMTALPYPLQDIYNGIKQLQTSRLIEIYKEIWALCTYSRALVNITFTDKNDVGEPLPFGKVIVTGASILYPGGGYDPENPPQVNMEIISNLSSLQIGTTTVGNDPNDPATYRRITGATLFPSVQGPVLDGIITAKIYPYPPNDSFGPVDENWDLRNQKINELIIEADAEIQNILTSSPENFAIAKLLNANWNQLGTALKIEQRARYTAIPPVPIPRDPFLALYPTALYNFVDALPDLAANTMPHGPAQSLEMLADQCSVGGQSLIGLMREARNQQRLSDIGIPLDNNIPSTLSEQDQREIMANGTKCGATQEGGVPSDNGLSFAMPAFPNTETCEGENLTPIKTTTYDTTFNTLRKYEDVKKGSIAPLLNDPNCSVVAGPQIPIGESILLDTGIPSFITIDLNSTLSLDFEPIVITNNIGNIVPDPLNVDYTSGILLPAQYDINDAINRVIECNCDCWIN
jgi:hypothetical protein